LGVPIQHLQQLDERQRRPCPATFVTGKSVHAAAEDLGRLALIEGELLADSRDEGRIHLRGVHLAMESEHCGTDAPRFRRIENRRRASRANIARHRRDERMSALVVDEKITSTANEVRGATRGTLHLHSSLNDTTSTSLITVSFRYTGPATVTGLYTSCQIRWSACVVMLLWKSSGSSACTIATTSSKSNP